MRLRPTSADELGTPWYLPNPPAPRYLPTTDGRLAALRRSVFADAVSAIRQDRPVKVATYVVAEHGADVDALHARLAESARDRGWRVHRDRFTDRPPTLGQFSARPQFNLACRLAGNGFVDGVLATGRDAMPADEAYEAYLRWMQRHCAFVAFPHPTYRGTPWTDR